MGITMPFSSIAIALSPSPSNATAKSHFSATSIFDASWRVEGLGSRFLANFPGESQLSATTSQPASERSAGPSLYAAAFPASTSTRGCAAFIAAASTFERRNAMYSCEKSFSVFFPALFHPAAVSPAETAFSISCSRLRANSLPFENSFMPLYSGGLCEAVTIAPSHFSFMVTYARSGVGATPMSMTSAPACIAPAASASESIGEVERQSRARTIFLPLAITPTALPTFLASSGVTSFP
ncbi:Uncharacterised protein [uncultured archaeon]|nr:Uncharacterised protein [uncultured archaeon]